MLAGHVQPGPHPYDVLRDAPASYFVASVSAVCSARPWKRTVENAAADVDRALAGTTFAWMLG